MQGNEGAEGPSGGGGGAGRAKGKAAAEELGGSKKKAGIFLRELRLMMYGFGDDPEPLPESVELVEEIVIEYITDLVHRAQEVAARRGRLTTEDVLFLIRKDPRKFARARELLAMNVELKEARKAFQEEQ